ncbi:MAG: NADH-quinone oxidoreductase subunit NuoG [Chloroflexota bacterium]
MADAAPPSDLVTLTIDGHEVKVPKGTLLVEAAKQVGIDIPVFCYHPKLKPVGACRMCLCEIEKMPRLQTACTSPVAEGMVVTTSSPNVVSAQNGVLELLLANHPLDCPICDKGGECPLQNNAFGYGLGQSRFTEEKRLKDKAVILSERIVLDRERCIMCYRCTRFQAEIPGDEALSAIDRGGFSEIGVLEGETFDSPFSGNTVELCPVGALTSRQYRFKARPWDLTHTPSVCNGCSVGCNVDVHTRDGRLLRMWGGDNPSVNDGWLCDAGRFDSLPGETGRLNQPMVRTGGRLQPATWEAALSRAAELLRGGSVGVAASSGISNEAAYVLADRLRPLLGQHAVGFAPAASNGWTVKGTLDGAATSKNVVLVGIDPWSELPVLSLRLRKAILAGATLVVIGSTNGLFRDSAHWLRVERGAEAAVVERLLAARQAGGGSARDAINGRMAERGRTPDAAAIAAAAAGLAEGPSTLLVGAHLARDVSTRAVLERLAEAIGATGDGGLVGSPSGGANARAIELIAPDVAASSAEDAASQASTVLQFGHAAAGGAGSGRRIVVSWSEADADDSADVVLPLAHSYEQTGSTTNLEGRVQLLNAAGRAPGEARPDWQVAADLVRALGSSSLGDLAAIRAALVGAYPSLTPPNPPVTRRARMALPVV